MSIPERPSPWGIPEALLVVVTMVAASLATGFLLLHAPLPGNDARDTVLTLLAAQAAMLAVALGVLRLRGRGARREVGLEVRAVDLGLGLLLAGLAFVAAVALTALVALATGEDLTPTALMAVRDQPLGPWLVLMAILIVTLVPVAEETAYRGVVWGALARRGVGPRGALVVSALVFALMHAEPLRLPALFAAGLVLGLGRLRTGRLGAGIIAHGLFNLPGALYLVMSAAS